MKLLFTGANGFVGKNVIPLLREKHFEVKTLGSHSTDYINDITKEIPSFKEMFEIIFHAAGKAHSIPLTEGDEKLFYDVNLVGTKNLCQSLEINLPNFFIFISSVAVYGKEFGDHINEEEPLQGNTPYAKSKILAEEFLIDWCKSNNVKLFIFRPSLIAGPNPPGNLGDMINAIKEGKYFNIAGGEAKKSIFWVEDFADLISKIIYKNGGVYNVADADYSFKEISIMITSALNKKSVRTIPYFVAKILALIGDLLGKRAPINSQKLNKIRSTLTFSNHKMKNELEFIPSSVKEKFQI